MLESKQKQCLSDLCGTASKNLFCHLFSLHRFLTGRERGKGGGGGVKGTRYWCFFFFSAFRFEREGRGGGEEGGEREREREREDRQTETETDRQTNKDRESCAFIPFPAFRFHKQTNKQTIRILRSA